MSGFARRLQQGVNYQSAGGSGGASSKLTWAPPTLTSPVTINLTNSSRKALMRPDTDYIVTLPSTPITTGGIELTGGRNVVLIGGEVNMTQNYAPDGTSVGNDNLALKIQGNNSSFTYTGAGDPVAPQNVHIEGLLITSTDPGFIADMCDINSQSQGAVGYEMTVTFENVRCDGLCYGWYQNSDGSQGPHSDVIQNYHGPNQIRMDHFTATRAGYQGFFLQQNGTSYTGGVSQYIYKYVDLHTDYGNKPSGSQYTEVTDGHYMWYQTDTSDDVALTECYAEKNPNHSDNPWYPTSGYWETRGLNSGVPSGGNWVPSGVAGTGYVSPGYQ